MSDKKDKMKELSLIVAVVTLGYLALSVPIFLIPAIIFISEYAPGHNTNFHDQSASCFVINCTILNYTCSLECYCDYGPIYKYCETCYYPCYYGLWYVEMNNGKNIESLITTISTDDQLDITYITTELDAHQNGTTGRCWYDKQNYYDVSWFQSHDDLYAFYVCMILFLCLLGCSILIGSIAIVGACFCSLYDNIKKKLISA